MVLEKEETPFNKWFSMKFTKREQKLWLKRYDIYKHQKEGIKSFPEFLQYCLILKGKTYPKFEDNTFLNTLETAYKTFISTPQGKVIRDVHPPLTDLTYKVTENTQAECIPFALAHEGSENPMARQQNFTNLSLHTIGQQLNRVESQVSQLKAPSEFLPKREKGETSGTKKEEKVLFMPMETKIIGLKVDDRAEMIDELTKSWQRSL